MWFLTAARWKYTHPHGETKTKRRWRHESQSLLPLLHLQIWLLRNGGDIRLIFIQGPLLWCYTSSLMKKCIILNSSLTWPLPTSALLVFIEPIKRSRTDMSHGNPLEMEAFSNTTQYVSCETHLACCWSCGHWSNYNHHAYFYWNRANTSAAKTPIYTSSVWRQPMMSPHQQLNSTAAMPKSMGSMHDFQNLKWRETELLSEKKRLRQDKSAFAKVNSNLSALLKNNRYTKMGQHSAWPCKQLW